jgi:hypothetical protein
MIDTAVLGMYASGNRFYTAWFQTWYGGLYDSGVDIYDVINPALPSLLGSHSVTNSPS